MAAACVFTSPCQTRSGAHHWLVSDRGKLIGRGTLKITPLLHQEKTGSSTKFGINSPIFYDIREFEILDGIKSFLEKQPTLQLDP
jgi:hypothetical protein